MTIGKLKVEKSLANIGSRFLILSIVSTFFRRGSASYPYFWKSITI